jgi:hypothetical protein
LSVPSEATTFIPLEEFNKRKALVARWDSLHGTWEGLVSEHWQPASRARIRLQINGPTIAVHIYRTGARSWVKLGEETKDYLGKELCVVTIESMARVYPGRYVLVFWRRDDNVGELIFSRHEDRIEPSGVAYDISVSQMYGLVKRKPASASLFQLQK